MRFEWPPAVVSPGHKTTFFHFRKQISSLFPNFPASRLSCEKNEIFKFWKFYGDIPSCVDNTILPLGSLLLPTVTNILFKPNPIFVRCFFNIFSCGNNLQKCVLKATVVAICSYEKFDFVFNLRIFLCQNHYGLDPICTRPIFVPIATTV